MQPQIPQTIGAFDAKTHFSELLNRVEAGEEIIITRRGKPIAKIVSTAERNTDSIKMAAERLLAMSQSHRLGGVSWRELRDEGRK